MVKHEIVFEAQVLFTHYGKEGETGRIEDVDRFTTNSVNALADALATYLAKELEAVWPPDYGASSLERTPRRLIFTITAERKGVKRYGKK
jgi:hypothetical protein